MREAITVTALCPGCRLGPATEQVLWHLIQLPLCLLSASLCSRSLSHTPPLPLLPLSQSQLQLGLGGHQQPGPGGAAPAAGGLHHRPRRCVRQLVMVGSASQLVRLLVLFIPCCGRCPCHHCCCYLCGTSVATRHACNLLPVLHRNQAHPSPPLSPLPLAASQGWTHLIKTAWWGSQKRCRILCRM